MQNRIEGAKSVDDTDVDGGWAGRQREGKGGGGGVDGLLSEDGCGIWQMMPQQHQRERGSHKRQSWRVETGTLEEFLIFQGHLTVSKLLGIILIRPKHAK